MSPVPPSSTSRIQHLDGLRAAAAMFVLVHHTYSMAFPIREGISPEGPLGFVVGWVLYGHFGVTIFIALAGYSLMLGLASKSGHLPGGLWGFMNRRAWRIVPTYAAALLMTVALVTWVIGNPTGTHWDQSLPASPRGWFVDALLLQDIIPVQNAAYTFWSISVEWHIYLLLPAVLFVRRRSSWPVAIAAGAGVGLIGMSLDLVDERFGRLHPEYYLLFALAAGACLVVSIAPAWAQRVPWKSIAAVCAATVTWLCLSNDFAWATSNFSWLDLIVGVGFLSLLITMGIGKSNWLASVFSFRPLTQIGVFSYSLYLVHAQLLQVFWQSAIIPFDVDRPTQLLIGWLVGVPLIVALSYVFSLVAERPFVLAAARKSARARELRRAGSRLNDHETDGVDGVAMPEAENELPGRRG